MQLVVARLYGTANINNCSFYCHNASSVALAACSARGTGVGRRSTISPRRPGAGRRRQPGEQSPAAHHAAPGAAPPRRAGDRREPAAGARTRPLPRPVGLAEPALRLDGLRPLPATARRLRRRRCSRRCSRPSSSAAASIARSSSRHTEGWDAVEADVRDASWSDLTTDCGVASRRGRASGRDARAGEARGAAAGRWVSRITLTASTTCLALANLALARGWLGRRGCGLLPIRGHSNVQGVGSVGVTPALKQAFAERMRRALRHRARPRGGLGHVSLHGRRRPRVASRSRFSSAATSSRATPTAHGRRKLCGASFP